MAGGAQAKMSTCFSKPNQSLISKVTKKRVGFNQYNMELRYILLNTGKDQKNNAWVVGHARSFWITRELRTQISGRCRLNPFNKCDVLSNNWPLIIGPKLIALRSWKFIACHSNPSVLNNASVLWCAKKVVCRSSWQGIITTLSAEVCFIH